MVDIERGPSTRIGLADDVAGLCVEMPESSIESSAWSATSFVTKQDLTSGNTM